MAILTVGIDLAKNVFALHGVNEVGKPELLQPRVPRAKLHALVATLPPCIIGIEACFGAHHWARLFHAAGPAQSLVGVVVARCNCGVESI
jgi:transposase